MSKISPLAHIHPDAQLADNVTIDPFAVIQGDVIYWRRNPYYVSCSNHGWFHYW